MGKPKGISITLYEKTLSGYDSFKAPVYTETAATVNNVLISPGDSTEITDTTNLNGRKTRYELAIPKGDSHTWTGNRVFFFGKYFRVVGNPVEGIEALLPLKWNRKVTVECIE